jgi:hypothetical protein
MAKNSVADWDTTAANNTDVGGLDINENCPAGNINNAIREVMAQVKSGVPVLSTVNTYTKIQKWAKGADVASASTLTLGDDGNYFDITGTTTITAIATKGAGTVVKLHFDASLTLTHHATDLILPGGANIVTAAGDEAEFVEYATGDWRCTNYTRASENWVDIASATTTDIGAAASQNVRVTGTTTITGLGTVAAGTFRRVRFAGALTLTYNATSLILPGAANITTVAGDVAEFISEGSGNWRCVNYEYALVQYGSNANGSWIRFPNGLQICQHTITTGALNVAAGAIFATADTTWTFPVAFASGQALSAYGSDSVGTAVWVSCGSYSSTSILVKGYCFTSAAARTIAVTAVGRWY